MAYAAEFFAGHFHAHALQAYKRCSEMQEAGQVFQWDAIASVVWSVISLETFSNELAEYSRILPGDPTDARQFG